MHQLYKWYESWKIYCSRWIEWYPNGMDVGFSLNKSMQEIKLLFLWFSLDIKRAVYDRRNLRNCHDMILIFNVLTDMYVYIYKENQTKNWLKWYDLTWTFDLAFKYIFYLCIEHFLHVPLSLHYNIYIFSFKKMQAYLDKVYANVWAKIWNIFSL